MGSTNNYSKYLRHYVDISQHSQSTILGLLFPNSQTEPECPSRESLRGGEPLARQGGTVVDSESDQPARKLKLRTLSELSMIVRLAGWCRASGKTGSLGLDPASITPVIAVSRGRRNTHPNLQYCAV